MAHARGIAHLIALAALALSLSNVARAAPDDSATDDALRPRGLAHVANAYLLDADAKLPEYLRLVRQSQRALDDHARRRAQIEADLKSADASVAAWDGPPRSPGRSRAPTN